MLEFIKDYVYLIKGWILLPFRLLAIEIQTWQKLRQIDKKLRTGRG